MAGPASRRESDRWQVTFTVADRDLSAALAERLGATIVSSEDTEWTKTALVRDPQGAELNAELVHPAGSLNRQPRRIGFSTSRTAGSSMVDGGGSSLPSAISRMVLRKILPERVFGSAGTTSTSLNAATAPISSRTAVTSSSARPSAEAPALSTTKPRGT